VYHGVLLLDPNEANGVAETQGLAQVNAVVDLDVDALGNFVDLDPQRSGVQA
jgi:hypothetical protein